MIRVDDEVYAFLNGRGRTEDSFNDVIRRELGLTPKKLLARGRPEEDLNDVLPREVDARIHPTASAERSSPSEVCAVLHSEEIVASLNRHLSPHWSDTPARREQILELVLAFLKTSRDWSTADRQLYAARQVAAAHRVEVNTVQDKCGRQLYGTGAGQQIERFRSALDRVEHELIEADRERGDGSN